MLTQTELYQKFENLSRTLDYELLLNAINSISSVREYDVAILKTAQGYNLIAFWAIIISVCITFVTFGVSVYIFKRQEKIIEEQLRVSNQQNKIALFEKRYESYVGHHIFIKNANQVYCDMVNTRFARGKCDFWMNFFVRLICPKDKQKWLSKEAERNGKPPIIPAIDELSSYILELKKIRYLFTLDAKELHKLDEIILKLEHSSDEVFDADVDEDIVQVDEFKNKLTELAKLIAESTFLKTMEKQL